MSWTPDYQYRIRGTWAAQGKDQIIVFDISNSLPVENIAQQDGSKRGRPKQIALYPDEWIGSFGSEFYEFSVRNGFYYIQTNRGWDSQIKSQEIPNSKSISTPTQEQLDFQIQEIKQRQA